MKPLQLAGLLFGALFGFTACGSSTPSTSAAESGLRQAIAGDSKDSLRLQDFQKTDGQAREYQGTKAYELDFTASIEFLDDLMFGASDSEVTAEAPGEILNNTAAFIWEGWFITAAGRRHMAFKGDQLKLAGSVVFVKKESGWVVQRVRLTNSSLDESRRAEGHSPVAMRAAAQTRAEEIQRQRAEAGIREREEHRKQAAEEIRVTNQNLPKAATILVGVWADQAGTLEFKADGTFRGESPDKRAESLGQWEVKGDVLTLTYRRDRRGTEWKDASNKELVSITYLTESEYRSTNARGAWTKYKVRD